MPIDFVPLVRRALFPVFIISQTLPLVAIAPLVVLWFGFGILPKIMLVALVTFFPMLVALVQGYEATEDDLQILLHAMGASRWRIFVLARLPSALPFFFAGLRISITYAVVGAIFAEYAGAESGLGIYMLNAKNNFRPDLVLAAVCVSAVLTLVLFAAAGMVAASGDAVAAPRRERRMSGPAASRTRRSAQAFRRCRRARRRQSDRARGRVRLPPRPVRSRKVDHLPVADRPPSRPTPGRCGSTAGRSTQLQRPFAYMPQHDALMPWRRILDNLTLGLEVQNVPRRAARARVLPLVAEFGLEGFERHYPAQLSGGMRQRAALLRTVVQQRRMLLLDEPFGALDALTRTRMQRWLKSLWREHDWTALLITHDVREAVFLSDRIYILSARPARVLREFAVPPPRLRTQSDDLSDSARAIEREVLAALLLTATD